MPDMMQFEIVRNVTLPFTIIPTDGTPIFLKFNTPIKPDESMFSERVRKSRKDGDGNATQPPMDIAEVTNLQTGEVGRLVVHSVLKSNLEESYPDASYTGKCFQIAKSKAAGKRYFNFNIIEIRLKSNNGEEHAKKTK